MLKGIELSELTLENIGVWPKEVKLIVISVCCLLLLILGYWFDTSSQIDQLNAKKRQEQEQLQQLEIKHQLAVNFPAYKKQLEEMRRSFKVMLQQLPGRTEVPGLLEDISKVGVASGLEFKLFKPLPEQQMDFYAELPIEIIVTGNYHQLGQFVSRVSSLNRIVTLHNYSIAQSLTASKQPQQEEIFSGNERLEMSITAKTYRYAEEQKKSADKKATPKK